MVTVARSFAELLNTTLSKLAHSKVTLLNKSTKHIDEVRAAAVWLSCVRWR